MSAIAGILGIPSDVKALQSMCQTMAQRGPDDSGIYRKEEITLLHTRLAIMDPSGGKQPMVLTWEGETYVLIYNGEIYNTEEIRKELLALGHIMTSSCDTEVLLHAYAQWGDGCLDRINGIFGFAVWQERARRLFLARDRMGVKPVFYALTSGGLLFASRISTILAHGGIPAQLDAQGAAQLLLLGPGRLPGSAIFHGIQELEAGCCGVYEDGRFRIRRYWSLKDREHTDSFYQTSETVRHLVTDAIARQSKADVSVGTFLSGGLDSSIITALCAESFAERGEVLPSFSVDYENSSQYFTANFFQPESDNRYIAIMQNQFHTRHYWSILSPQTLFQNLETAVLARDLPGMADVDSSLLAFCADIRPHVKVALSGECADELFGGYPWYRDPQTRDADGFPWARNTDYRAAFLKESISSCLNPRDFVMDAYKTTCEESDILPGTSQEENRIKQMMNLNVRWFMRTLAERKDTMSMYHSLEVRVPFCDYRIAEYLYGVPWAFKDFRGREKGLLRHAMEGLLPEPVLYRKKSPYPKTFDPRYEAMVREELESLLAQDAAIWSVISKTEVKNLLDSDLTTPWYGQLMRKPQLMGYFLQIHFWLEHYHVALKF